METLGVIDIGSNSVRLILATIDERGFFKILDEVKESVRLGKDTGPSGELSHERMDRAVAALRVFKTLCDSVKASHIITIATAAVRSAPNKDAFLERARKEADLDIKVISGLEEAYYDYFGAINSMTFERGLIMDIGGCSTELIYVENRTLINSISLPFGAISITDMFNLSNKLSESVLQDMASFFQKGFEDVEWLKKVKGVPLIGIGGTFRNLGKVDRKKKKYPLDVSHNYKMDRKSMNNLFNIIESSDLKKRRSLKGLSKERADIILGATILIDALSDYCEITDLYVSGSGLREGVSYEYVLKGRDTPVSDVVGHEIMSMVRRYGLRENHALHIWKLTKSIYSQLEPIHKIKRDITKILKAAAMLHDVGVSVSYYDHHKHSFYIILNSLIKGLDHDEIVMAAFLAKSHRKDDAEVEKSEFASMLSESDKDMISKVGVFLKIAECLDRRLDGTIRDVRLTIKKDTVNLKMITDVENTELERSNLQIILPIFKAVFDKELNIV